MDSERIAERINEYTTATFKRDAMQHDFVVASAILHLMNELPASHGITSIANVLKGKSKAIKNNRFKGLCEGMREYPDVKLRRYADQLESWTRENGLTEHVYVEDDPNKPYDEQRPEWLCRDRKTSGILLTWLAEAIEESKDLGKEVKVETSKELDFQMAKATFKNCLDGNHDKIVSAIQEMLKTHRIVEWYETDYVTDWHSGAHGEFITKLLAGGTAYKGHPNKRKTKDGNYSLSSRVTKAFVPQDWHPELQANVQDKTYHNVFMHHSGGSGDEFQKEYQAAVAQKNWRKELYVEGCKPAAKALTATVVFDPDGNIIGGIDLAWKNMRG